MNKKVMSLLLSLILVVTSVFVSNIVAYAAEQSGGRKVTATSNYFPKKSTFIANDKEYVTVTYFINSSKDMLSTQWKLNYDPSFLEFAYSANMNESGANLILMPSVDDLVWNVITDEKTGEQTGRIEANATKLKLYKFAGKGYIPFVTVTFKVIGSGETTVDLFVDNLTLSRLGSNFMTDPAEEEVIVDFGVINDTTTVPSRETAVHSGLYDPHCNITAPVISGVEDGKTYCDTVEFTVTDNDGIASVKAGNTELTESNGKYTLEKGAGTVTIVATDKAKNETTITVTVNNGHTAGNDDGNCTTPVYCIYHPDTVVVAANSHDFSGEWHNDGTGHWHICQNDGCTVAEPKASHSGTDDGDCTTAVICECGYTITAANAEHTYEWQDDNGQYWKKCQYCDDETAKKDIPTITINGADAVCVTQDYKFSFTLPQGATDAVYGYEFENKGDLGLPAIIENNEPHGVVSMEWYEPSENSFKVYAGAKTADGFEFFVSKTVQIQNEHAGGVATCVELAICDTCGEEYGELDSTNHNLEKIFAKASSVVEIGNIEYWHCKDCGKFFTDENGENEIELKDTVIAKLSPEIIKGKGQSVTEGENKALSFTSDAAYSDFIRVEFDGKTLDEKKYTVKEGSTVVTLKADYVATLSAGEHTIGIVSESGTAETTFTVNEKAVDDTPQADDDTKSPQTDDNSHMALWFVLLFVSTDTIIVIGAYGKKKKRAEK